MPTQRAGWQLLVMSLSGRKAASRMRAWRQLRATGAAVLRDGVYLLPDSAPDNALEGAAEAVLEAGGTAYRFQVHTEPAASDDLRGLFDRAAAYSAFDTALAALQTELPRLTETQARRRLAQLRRDFTTLTEIDYFPGEAQTRSAAGLQHCAERLEQIYSAHEPQARAGSVTPRSRQDYQGRLWATRKKLWVDRVASAWLIRRFIDPQARFVWLDKPQDCPSDALGFDFDGASFSHVGALVTFEVLLVSFELQADPGLKRLAALVHYLDAGGTPIPEADGFAAILAGARDRHADDDRLLAYIGPLLDDLYTTFSES